MTLLGTKAQSLSVLTAVLYSSEEADARIGILQGGKETARAHHLLSKVPLLI